jgi:hypothetical protein
MAHYVVTGHCISPAFFPDAMTYVACLRCKRVCRDAVPPLRNAECGTCGGVGAAHRWRLKLRLSDGLCIRDCTVFGDAANAVMGISANAFARLRARDAVLAERLRLFLVGRSFALSFLRSQVTDESKRAAMTTTTTASTSFKNVRSKTFTDSASDAPRGRRRFDCARYGHENYDEYMKRRYNDDNDNNDNGNNDDGRAPYERPTELFGRPVVTFDYSPAHVRELNCPSLASTGVPECIGHRIALVFDAGRGATKTNNGGSDNISVAARTFVAAAFVGADAAALSHYGKENDRRAAVPSQIPHDHASQLSQASTQMSDYSQASSIFLSLLANDDGGGFASKRVSLSPASASQRSEFLFTLHGDDGGDVHADDVVDVVSVNLEDDDDDGDDAMRISSRVDKVGDGVRDGDFSEFDNSFVDSQGRSFEQLLCDAAHITSSAKVIDMKVDGGSGDGGGGGDGGGMIVDGTGSGFAEFDDSFVDSQGRSFKQLLCELNI